MMQAAMEGKKKKKPVQAIEPDLCRHHPPTEIGRMEKGKSTVWNMRGRTSSTHTRWSRSQQSRSGSTAELFGAC